MFEMRGIPFVLLDIACLVLAGLPSLILNVKHTPFRRGFFCNDDSIKYPLKEDTISYELLGGVMIPFTIFTIIFGECLSVYLKRIKSKSPFGSYISCVYKAIGTFLFGAAMSQSLTDIAKYSIGRLRPHFLDVCKPDWKLVNCSSGDYIEDFTCTGDAKMVNEGRSFPELSGNVPTHPSLLWVAHCAFTRVWCTIIDISWSPITALRQLSFYSGHSSFSMYCMLFLALYLQARLQAEWARLLRPTLQFFLIAASVYTGLSRVSDYKHHWSDVLTGLLQGALMAILVVFCVSDFFKPRVDAHQEVNIPHTTLQETPTNGNHCESPN
ncbi:phospholipid phosphatase 1 isoform X2 [Sander lucioperca]|uniref:phospholipid phosphatase 1 isoform X2 n=2 Tax=Sander lucioperca TaxID=283035 RepID=UPI00125E5792|nr:phospholipid phosphatase 1 isoform X2 [Sander lucioperca]